MLINHLRKGSNIMYLNNELKERLNHNDKVQCRKIHNKC